MTRLPPDQFARMVKQHHVAVYRSALRIVMDEATAADVAQDVFLRALRGKVRFDKARDPVATLCWLAARLAQNANRARRRRRNHEENAMQQPNTTPADDPAIVAANHDLQDAVRRTVDELPEDLRVPLQLHCSDEWTLMAVGAALQLSTSTVHDRVQLALQRLRAQLRGRGFAVAATAIPNLVRELPDVVVPPGLEAQLLAAGKTAAVVGVDMVRRVAMSTVFLAAVVGVAITANALADRVEPGAIATAADAVASSAMQDPKPASTMPALAERARILPGGADSEAYREAVQRLPEPTPPQFVVLKGTVHDAAAWPVAGATVQVVAAGGLKSFGLGSGRSNHLGAFSVEVDVGTLQPSAVRVRVIEDTTTLLVTNEITLTKGQPLAPLQLVLSEQVGLATDRFEWHLFAHDEAGVGLPGVKIASLPAPLSAAGKAQGFRDMQAITDDNGHCLLRGRRPGERWLLVDGRGIGRGYTFERVAIAGAGSHNRRVLVPKGKELSVRLLAIGEQRLQYASVWLHDERLGLRVDAAKGERIAAGREILFTGLGEGPYTVFAAAGGCSRSAIYQATAQAQVLTIEVKPLLDTRDVGNHMAEIHGGVFDAATGEALAWTPECVEVLRARSGDSSLACDRLVPPSPRQSMVEMRKVKAFHEDALEPGHHALLVAVPGYATAVHEFEVRAGELLTDVRVELHRGAVIRGRLLNAQGQPVAKRRVLAIGHGSLADAQLHKWREYKRGGREWTAPPTMSCYGAVSDERGVFEVQRAPVGVPLRLFAVCVGGGVGVVLVVALAEGEVRDEVQLVVTQ